jgi:HSP20 family protein
MSASRKEETAVETKDRAQPQPVELTRDRPVFAPATDIAEREDAVVVLCDMPGVDEQRLDITLEEGVLTLLGYPDAAAPADHELVYRGYTPGVFRRAFTLGSDVDPNKIRAKIANGVLRLELGKLEQSQPRKIPVQTE